MSPNPQQHNPTCARNYLVMINQVNQTVFPMLTRRQRWDCPACAVHKLAKAIEHVVTRSDTLCWGPHTPTKQQLASRRGIGFMTIGYRDDVKMMVAGSHLYEPPIPSLDLANLLISHTATRKVTRLGWSDNWRPNPNGNPEQWEIIDCKTDDLSRVIAAMNRAGIVDGKLGKKSAYEVKSTIEQILNGVTFNSGK